VRGTIIIDIDRCVACKRCVIECAIAHSESSNIFEAASEYPAPKSRVSIQPWGSFSVPVQCRHCEGAPCAIVCPTGAMHRIDKDGPVILDNSLCVGCGSCALVCQFGVPRITADRKAVYKCDLCIDRLEEGQEPACVSACHTDALVFVSTDELKKRYSKSFSERYRGADASG